MDFDSFLTSPRWEILQIIAEKPSSPVEIAEKLNTTVSYVSQQLKLLDAAGLLIKEKTGAAQRGKPRNLYSISKEILYLTALTESFTEKKLIYITEHHKKILKIWLIKDPTLHYYIEKLFWKLEEDLEEIDAIFIETNIVSKVIIVTDSKKIKTRVESIIKKFDRKIEYDVISKSQLKKLSSESVDFLHDPLNLKKEMKGGETDYD